MARRPRQYGARNAEMPRGASIGDPALTDFGLKRHKLLIRPSARWPIDNSDLTRLQLGMIKL
jgi:hypothetical protein